MKQYFRPATAALLLTLISSFTVGCSDSSSNATPAPVPAPDRLAGTVVDGYVSGARVTLYNLTDFGGPATLASGTTDANGDFLLSVPAGTLPDRLAMLSTGGTVIDTGLPAPTLALVALRDQDRYYVTPLTDRVARQGFRANAGFVDAEQNLSAELGLTLTELYQDPLASDAPQALTDALYRTLSTGDYSTVPSDGDYRLSLVYLQQNNIGDAFSDIDSLLASQALSGTVSISDGTLSGSLGGESVSGRVNGSSLVMDVAYTDGVTRVAGDLGLLGSLSGNFVDFDASGASPAVSTGVFVATLVPDTGVNASGIESLIDNLYAANRNGLFRDLYGDQDMAWGPMASVSTNAAADAISSGPFDITLNAAGGTSDSLTFDAGRLLTFGDGTPNGLAVLRYTDTSGDYAYLVQALGNRRGIYVAGDNATDAAYAIGESYLARRDATGTDTLSGAAGSNVSLAVTGIDAHTLGALRNPAGLIETGITYAVPTLTDGSGADGSADTDPGVFVISGGLMGLKNSAAGADNAVLDHADDFMVVTETLPSGAIQGDIITGGTLANLGNADASDFPVPLVGFGAPEGTDTSLLSFGDVQLNFLARPLYMIDTQTNELVSLSAYEQSLITGSILSGDSSATLNFTDGQGQTGTAALTVQNVGGIYHYEGEVDSEYLDIFWPAGGNRALYMVSDAATGDGTVYEIGEAYMSY